jgi:hypothetical protein
MGETGAPGAWLGTKPIRGGAARKWSAGSCSGASANGCDAGITRCQNASCITKIWLLQQLHGAWTCALCERTGEKLWWYSAVL